jgi:1,4-alpha-glucan branching enzyme
MNRAIVKERRTGRVSRHATGEKPTNTPPLEPNPRVSFQFAAEPGSAVFVAGTFNNWDPTVTQLTDSPDGGQFKTSVRVTAGKHEYKFVVDGVWCVDPNCADWRSNGHGTLNSVLHA